MKGIYRNPLSSPVISYHNNAVYTRAAGLEKVSFFTAVGLNVLLPSSPEIKTNGTNTHITSYNPLPASGPRLVRPNFQKARNEWNLSENVPLQEEPPN